MAVSSTIIGMLNHKTFGESLKSYILVTTVRQNNDSGSFVSVIVNCIKVVMMNGQNLEKVNKIKRLGIILVSKISLEENGVFL